LIDPDEILKEEYPVKDVPARSDFRVFKKMGCAEFSLSRI
jgi:hypothetical protein